VTLFSQGDQITILNPRLSLSVCRESSHETSLSRPRACGSRIVVARYLPWRRTVYSFFPEAAVRDALLPVQPRLKLRLIVTNRRELDIAPHRCQVQSGVMQTHLRGAVDGARTWAPALANSGCGQELGPVRPVADLPAERTQLIA
jgi:hypothetical protein